MLDKYMLLRVCRALLRNPRKEYTMRSMAKESRVGVSTSKRCLDYLVKKKIANKKSVANLLQFSLNNSFIVTKHLKILKVVSDIAYSGILEEIIEKASPASVILYGTCASGEYDEKSDVDLLIIANSNRSFILENSLKKEVNYQIYTPGQWREKAKGDKVFYDNVIINSIVLYGEKPVVL